jgi:small-conductance mechanosensitive channel
MVSLILASTPAEAFVRIVQYFLLGTALSAFPYVVFMLVVYLLAPVPPLNPAAAQPAQSVPDELLLPIPELASIQLERAVGAVAAAATCLALFAIFKVIEFTDHNYYTFIFQSRLPALSIDRTDFYIAVSRILVTTFFACLFCLFYIALKWSISSFAWRMTLFGYVVLYFGCSISFSGKYTVLKILSFYLANFLAPFSSEAPVINDAGYWPELLLQYVFYFIIVFCTLKYMGIYFVRRIKSDREGDFDVKAIWIAVYAFTWILSAFIGFMFMQINFVSLGIFTGVLGAGVSIAFRDLLNNFFSGILLNLDNSIKIGDVIRTTDNVVGEVQQISLRYTFLATRDNVDILIPNSVLVQSRFENLTRTKQEVRLSLRFSVGQDADIARVREVATQACLIVPEVSAAMGKPAVLFFVGASETANLFDLRFWVVDPRPGPAKLQSDVAYAIFGAFKREKIPLPSFHLFNPSVERSLRGLGPPPARKSRGFADRPRRDGRNG